MAFKPFQQPLPFIRRSHRAYRHSIHPTQPVKLSDMLRVSYVNSINNPLLVRSKPLERPKQPFNTWPHVKFLPQFLHLEIPVRTTFLQGVYFLLFLTVRTYRIIVIRREPTISDKLLDTPRLHHHLKQISKPIAAHTVRCSRKPQEPRLRPLRPQHLISLGQSMMRLVNHYQRRGKEKAERTEL